MHFARNIQLLRKRKKRSQEDIAGAIGIKRTTLSAYELGTVEPSLETLVKFSRFFKVSIDKLLLLDLATISEMYLSELERGIDFDITGKKLRVLATTVDKENYDNIEVVPLKAKAGYTNGYADPDFIRVLPTFQLPFLNKNKKYRAFQVSGDSMPPVPDGGWVTGEYVQNWKLIRSGYPHIIVTKEEGVVFKIVHNKVDVNQSLLLCSTNPIYKPYEVNINEVLEVWLFVNYISGELADSYVPRDELNNVVMDLQREVEEIKMKLKS